MSQHKYIRSSDVVGNDQCRRGYGFLADHLNPEVQSPAIQPTPVVDGPGQTLPVTRTITRKRHVEEQPSDQSQHLNSNQRKKAPGHPQPSHILPSEKPRIFCFQFENITEQEIENRFHLRSYHFTPGNDFGTFYSGHGQQLQTHPGPGFMRP